MASESTETLIDCTANDGAPKAVSEAIRTTTPRRTRQALAAPEARFASRPGRSARARARRQSKGCSVKIGPRQSWTRVALDQREQEVVAPRAVDPEKSPRITLAPEAVALEQGDGGRVLGDARRLDAMQAQSRKGEFDRRGDGARHPPLAGVRRAHPVAEGAALRHPAPDAAERDPAQEFVVGAVENEERIGLVASHVVVLAPKAPAKGRSGQVVVRPSRLPRLEKAAARGPESGPGRIVGRRRRAQINLVAAQQRLRAYRSRQAEKRHHTPFKAPATFAWPGTLPTAPIAAKAGGDLSMAAPVLRTSSTEMASTRASISSNESGRP